MKSEVEREAYRRRRALVIQFVGPIYAAFASEPAQLDMNGNQLGRDSIEDALESAAALADEVLKRFPDVP